MKTHNRPYVGWVARNHGEHDIHNISLEKTKATAKKIWGRHGQEILRAVVLVGEDAEDWLKTQKTHG